MKKLILYCALATTFSTACRTQLTKSKYKVQVFPTTNKALLGVKGPNYEGTIFTEKYPFQHLFVSDVDSTNRFTPSVEEIEIVDNILLHNLKTINKQRPNQQDGNPVLHRNLPKYFRQYVGFTDNQGSKIIHINFSWNRRSLVGRIEDYLDKTYSRLKYNSNYQLTFDGVSYYWSINANLTKRELTNLGVHGNG
ncbi:MAG: hypothetical protein EOO63_07690 [Hymenobacter sp.]|nr:MAG: hypothetical protein EOO63_07690 [Hymenobacter sp.]